MLLNPSEHSVALLRQEGVSESEVVDVTSSTGGTKEVRTRNLFEAEIEIEESGRYALLLDVGQKMAMVPASVDLASVKGCHLSFQTHFAVKLAGQFIVCRFKFIFRDAI